MPGEVFLFLNTYCGHIACEYHGDHQPMLYAEWHPFTKRYNFIVDSACYGYHHELGMKADEMYRVMEKHLFMPHTRQAYRQMHRAMKIVRDDAMTQEHVRRKFPLLASQARAQETPTTGTIAEFLNTFPIWRDPVQVNDPLAIVDEWSPTQTVEDARRAVYTMATATPYPARPVSVVSPSLISETIAWSDWLDFTEEESPF